MTSITNFLREKLSVSQKSLPASDRCRGKECCGKGNGWNHYCAACYSRFQVQTIKAHSHGEESLRFGRHRRQKKQSRRPSKWQHLSWGILCLSIKDNFLFVCFVQLLLPSLCDCICARRQPSSLIGQRRRICKRLHFSCTRRMWEAWTRARTLRCSFGVFSRKQSLAQWYARTSIPLIALHTACATVFEGELLYSIVVAKCVVRWRLLRKRRRVVLQHCTSTADTAFSQIF